MHHAHVDRIVLLEPGRCARGMKCVSLRDEALGEHFPGNPVLPGVFLLKALAQTEGVLLWKSASERRMAVLASIDRARFAQNDYLTTAPERHTTRCLRRIHYRSGKLP